MNEEGALEVGVGGSGGVVPLDYYMDVKRVTMHSKVPTYGLDRLCMRSGCQSGVRQRRRCCASQSPRCRARR